MPDPQQQTVPQSQPQQPQTPPQVSDKTIDAFMAVSDDKKREALGKMSEPTKQALLQGIKTRKGVSTIPIQPVEKAMPFSSGVASGMMLDPTKIASQKTTMGQVGEVGKEMASGAMDLGKSILKDPLNVGKPIDAIVKGQESAYKKVHEGLKSGNHDELMNGLGEAVGNLSMLLGGAKVDEGIGVKSTLRDASFAAKDLTAKRAIVSAASNAALDQLRDAHSAAIDTAIKSERARIGGNVEAINVADRATSPQGYVPKTLVSNVVDQAIKDKNASALEATKNLPGTSSVKKLVSAYGPNLSFDNLKDIRSMIDSEINNAGGKDRAILGDLRESFTKNMKGRAAQLGKSQEFNDYVDSSKAISDQQRGLIPELKGSKTGLDYAKTIASESNKGRLDKLTKDLHLPDDFFSKDVRAHKAIINFAKMSEGDSLVAKTANRLIALKSHPISASLGGTAGVLAGRAIGSAIGSPMAGSFIGLTLGAAFAHDLMSKYDAAKAIREIGGPSGVMGAPRSGQAPPPSSSSSPSSGPTPGPGGGGITPPAKPPVMPSGSSPIPTDSSRLSPALANLLPGSPEEREAIVKKAMLEGSYKPTPGQGSEAFDKPDSRAKASESKASEPQVTKAPPEARGREASARKGMTKDTPEARKAKAAERIAARRAEASRTNIKSSLEDQARQVAGRMDFQGKSNVELEEGLQTLFGDNGKRFLKQFQQLAKQQKWSDEIYRGYLEDTIDRRAKELAQRPNVPGLGTEPKVE